MPWGPETPEGGCDRVGVAMESEIGQLVRRYEALRTRSAIRERRLLASLAEIGQQAPVIVVRDGERLVVVDGYKRLRALGRLGHDTVQTIGGVIGSIVEVKNDSVVLKVDESSNTRITFSRSAIQQVLNSDTKSAPPDLEKTP